MELTFASTTADYLRRTVHLTLTQELTQEMVIPDSMPDARQTLICNAQAELQNKICRAGSVQLTGTVRTDCLYLPEDAQPAQLLEAQLPFSIQAENDALQEDTSVLVRLFVRSAEAKLINSRKLLLRIGLCAVLDGFEAASAVISAAQEFPACVQLHTRTLPLRLPVEAAERTVQLSEELELPQGKPEIDRIIGYSLLPSVAEEKIVGNKALFKGTLQLRICYFDAEQRISAATLQIPMSQYCELRQDYEDETPAFTLVLTGSQLEPVLSGSGQRLLFGCGLLTQCIVTAVRPITVCDDAYTTRGTLTPVWTMCELPMLLDDLQLRQPIRESVQAQAEQLLDLRLYPDEPIRSGAEEWQLPISVHALFLDADGALTGTTARVQTSVRAAMPESAVCYAAVQMLPDGFASCGAGSIDLRCEAMVTLQAFSDQSLRTLSAAELDETAGNKAGPAVVICRMETEQEVWSLAKSYRTTEAAIRSANHLTDAQIDAGTLVLIPM